MEAAQDLVALAKGMIDAAGIAGESDQRLLVDRVCRAALGYLQYPVFMPDDNYRGCPDDSEHSV